jgi:pSer/pThr/pTyr-binding forkhead associated (FHA) protein
VITTENSCVIEDLNSTNGIYVKSNRVRRHYLNDGDVVLVGKHELMYVDDRATRTRATPVAAPPPQAQAAAEEEAEEAEASGGRAPLRQT